MRSGGEKLSLLLVINVGSKCRFRIGLKIKSAIAKIRPLTNPLYCY